MSSITGLISAGGGAGGGETHIVTDPRKLPRYAFYSATIKTSNTATQDSTGSGFFGTVNSKINGAMVEGTTNDTYSTLLDITSAANGGYLHWVISQTVHSLDNSKVTVRFTVDGGTPVEIAYDYQAVNGRMFIGGGIYIAGSSTSDTTAYTSTMRSNNYYNGYFSATANSFQDSTNFVPYIGQNGTRVQIESSMPDLMTLPYHRLYFESSLKVEVKQQSNAADFGGKYAACLYTLI